MQATKEKIFRFCPMTVGQLTNTQSLNILLHENTRATCIIYYFHLSFPRVHSLAKLYISSFTGMP